MKPPLGSPLLSSKLHTPCSMDKFSLGRFIDSAVASIAQQRLANHPLGRRILHQRCSVTIHPAAASIPAITSQTYDTYPHGLGGNK